MHLSAQFVLELCVNPSLISQLSDAEISQLVIVLRHQKILARFGYFVKSHGLLSSLDDKTQRHLSNALKIAERQREQVELEACQLSDILRETSDFVVFLKGAAYSLGDALVGKGRTYSDIDILVNKPQLKACEQLLGMYGWIGQEINDYDDRYYRKWAHEIPPLAHMHRGTIIDIHHNIVPIVSRDAPTVAALASHIETNSFGVQVLSEAAQFVHSSVHLFRNEDYQTAFRDVFDLYLMINGKPVSFFDNIVSVASTLGFKYEVGLAFDMLQRLFLVEIDANLRASCLTKTGIRIAFDRFVFSRVLLPQHHLLMHSRTPFMHFLAVVRGHCVKMPIHLLCYHLMVKSARNILEALFGKHIFTPTENPNTPTHKQ